MPCNAIATIKAKLSFAEGLQEAISQLTPNQAEALYKALLIEGTKFTVRNIDISKNDRVLRITCGAITVNIGIDNRTGLCDRINIIDPFNDFTVEELEAKIARFTAQTIKAANMIKQAKALAAIQARYPGASTSTAPNGSKIITLDL